MSDETRDFIEAQTERMRLANEFGSGFHERIKLTEQYPELLDFVIQMNNAREVQPIESD